MTGVQTCALPISLLDCGIERIIIGTGYHKEFYEELAKTYPQIECCFSPRFAETNCLYTLWNCREMVGDDDILMLDSDLVYERRGISELLACPHDSAILTAPLTKFQDAYYVEQNPDGQFIAWSKDRNAINPCGELVGIHKLSNAFYKAVCDYYTPIVTACVHGVRAYNLMFAVGFVPDGYKMDTVFLFCLYQGL